MRDSVACSDDILRGEVGRDGWSGEKRRKRGREGKREEEGWKKEVRREIVRREGELSRVVMGL